VWDTLQGRKHARAPLPPHERIPNFEGARRAAPGIFHYAPWSSARDLKINPDSPQLWVRIEALRRGVRVYVPTPKLAGGFNLLDPARIPASSFREAAELRTMSKWATTVALDDLPQLDGIVTGCAAVTLAGKRCGKGAGYSDIEFGMLRELGHAPVPVATTVHEVQVVGDFPVESNDLPLSLICTPERSIHIEAPLAAPVGIQWERLSAQDLDAMPVLHELQRIVRETH
jgi:5-formyltetrahydrofolate cyclo-ligase